jgi:hypothetical protein
VGEWSAARIRYIKAYAGEMYVPELGYKKAFFSNNSIVEVI